jgi:hypothetical protein
LVGLAAVGGPAGSTKPEGRGGGHEDHHTLREDTNMNNPTQACRVTPSHIPHTMATIRGCNIQTSDIITPTSTSKPRKKERKREREKEREKERMRERGRKKERKHESMKAR